MTKKDFVLIAKTLADTAYICNFTTTQLIQSIYAFQHMLETQNPRFNEDKFEEYVKACYKTLGGRMHD